MNIADVTADLTLDATSRRPERHPVFGTDAYAIRLQGPLDRFQLNYCQQLLADGITGFRFTIRSALAQVGDDAGHPSCTAIALDGNALTVETLITSVHEGGVPLLERMIARQREGRPTRVGRMGLLHPASQVSPEQLDDAQRQEGLIAGGQSLPDGTLRLAVSGPLCTFDPSPLKNDAFLDALLDGSARGALTKIRAYHALPESVPAQGFLVANFLLSSPAYHVVLDRMTEVHGCASGVLHSESCFLDAGRTHNEGGSRQLELFNCNGHAVDTGSISVIARLFHPRRVAIPAV